MLVSSQFVGDDVVFRPSLYEKGKVHSLHSIFQYLARGYSHKRMKEVQKDILPEMIDATREILIDRNSRYFPDTQGEKFLHDYKVLVDENTTPDVTGFLRAHFRKVLHVNDVGLSGQKDDRVWEWAVNNGCNIIFTKDSANKTERDLTYLATQDARSILRAMETRSGNNFILSDLPLIVHLAGGCDAEAELKILLRRKKEKFYNFVSNRATPYIDIRGEKIICGPTYFELRGGNHVEDNNIPESGLSRKIETRELFKALWLGRLSSQDLRNMSPERERKVDDQIEVYMQKQAERAAKAKRFCRSREPEQSLSR